ncbi:MAG: hypothetical protein NT175_14425 [Bacteroidetes bacterium]|nr:hypothetical protein [Bacteroidota bacterium]
MDLIQKFKPGVTRRTLLIVVGLLWGYAAFRVLRIGIIKLEMNPFHYWIKILIGFVGFLFFFRLVFFYVVRKHRRRILSLKPDRPCVFSFFNIRGYIIMACMITLGIIVVRGSFLPPDYLGEFYVALGLSLLASALYNIYHWIRFPKEFKTKRDTNGVSYS